MTCEHCEGTGNTHDSIMGAFSLSWQPPLLDAGARPMYPWEMDTRDTHGADDPALLARRMFRTSTATAAALALLVGVAMALFDGRLAALDADLARERLLTRNALGPRVAGSWTLERDGSAAAGKFDRATPSPSFGDLAAYELSPELVPDPPFEIHVRTRASEPDLGPRVVFATGPQGECGVDLNGPGISSHAVFHRRGDYSEQVAQLDVHADHEGRRYHEFVLRVEDGWLGLGVHGAQTTTAVPTCDGESRARVELRDRDAASPLDRVRVVSGDGDVLHEQSFGMAGWTAALSPDVRGAPGWKRVAGLVVLLALISLVEGLCLYAIVRWRPVFANRYSRTALLATPALAALALVVRDVLEISVVSAAAAVAVILAARLVAFLHHDTAPEAAPRRPITWHVIGWGLYGVGCGLVWWWENVRFVEVGWGLGLAAVFGPPVFGAIAAAAGRRPDPVPVLLSAAQLPAIAAVVLAAPPSSPLGLVALGTLPWLVVENQRVAGAPRFRGAAGIAFVCLLALAGVAAENALRRDVWANPHFLWEPRVRARLPDFLTHEVGDRSLIQWTRDAPPDDVLDIEGVVHPVRKGPDVFRVLCLGSSSTAGVGATDPATHGYPAALERRLQERTERPVEVVNAGIPGAQLYTLWVLFDHAFVHLDPDLVVLYYGFNGEIFGSQDYYDHLRERLAASPHIDTREEMWVATHLRWTPPWMVDGFLAAARSRTFMAAVDGVNTLRAGGVEVVNPADTASEDSAAHITAACVERGIPIVLAPEVIAYEVGTDLRSHPYHEAFEILGERHAGQGVHVVDLVEHFTPAMASVWMVDFVHMRNGGYAHLADGVVEFLWERDLVPAEQPAEE